MASISAQNKIRGRKDVKKYRKKTRKGQKSLLGEREIDCGKERERWRSREKEMEI